MKSGLGCLLLPAGIFDCPKLAGILPPAGGSTLPPPSGTPAPKGIPLMGGLLLRGGGRLGWEIPLAIGGIACEGRGWLTVLGPLGGDPKKGAD